MPNKQTYFLTMLLNELVNSNTYRLITSNVCHNSELKEDLHSEAIMVIIEKSYDLSEIRNLAHFFAAVVWKTWHSNKFRKKYFRKETSVSEEYYLKIINTSQLNTLDRVPDDELHGFEISYSQSVSKDITFKTITDFINSDPVSENDYYEKNLFKIYLEERDSKSVSRRTNIPYRTVANDIKSIKDKLKKLHNEENSD